MAKGAYIGVDNFTPRALPDGYTQVGYIESVGKQYIDTGFKPKYNSRVVMDVSGLGASGILFGVRDANSATAQNQFVLYRKNETSIRSDYFGTNATLSISDTSMRTTIDKNANVVTLYGETITNTAVSSGECTYPMYLFTMNNVGAVHSTYAKYKLHSCKIYDNGVLVRDFVPCTNSDGTAGLYDMVNAVFYTNAGSGTFAVGSSATSVAQKVKKGYVGIEGVARKIKKAYVGIGGGVTYREVDYIQSSGTQYIDTGFKPNQNTRVRIDFEVTALPTDYSAIFSSRNSPTASTNNGAFSLWVNKSVPSFLWQYNTNVGKNTAANAPVVVGNRVVAENRANVMTVGGYALTESSAVFTGSYSLYILATNDSGSNRYATKAKVYACQIYDNGTIVRDYVPVVDPNGVPGMFDRITKHFFANAGTGNFIAGEETGSTYISNGIARPVWSGGELAYYGEITSLSVAREGLAAARTQNRALFAGGYQFDGTTDGWSNAVDAYDKSLTRKTAPTLWYSVEECAGTSVGNYALFAGGYTGNDEVYYVNAYNDSLTQKNPDNLIRGRYEMGAASVGNYALFAGGTCTSDMWSDVDYYNKSLTHGTASNGLTVPRHMLTGASVGSYAIFAGGRASSGGESAVADAYNSSLTRVTVPSLSYGRRDPAAATVGGYALFAGGEANSSVSMRVVDVYNESLTKTKATDLSNASKELAGTAIGECAIFAGGLNSIVDVYDTSLVKKLSTDFPTLRLGLAASTVGDFALFAGGRDNYTVTYANTYAYTLV